MSSLTHKHEFYHTVDHAVFNFSIKYEIVRYSNALLAFVHL